MAADTPTTFTEDGARRLIEEYMRTTGQPRNDFHRRRRHVNLGGVSRGTDVVMFRLEEELLVGEAADARIMDLAELVTAAGTLIAVQDDQRKWFARGSTAPSGDTGGDAPGTANIGYCIPTGSAEEDGTPIYTILSCGTWYRWIEGFLSNDSWQVSTVTGWDGSWARDDSGSTGGTITLSGVCVEPIAGMYFKAVFDEQNPSYKIVTLCCAD